MTTHIDDKLPIRLVVEACHMPAFYYNKLGKRVASANRKFKSDHPLLSLEKLIEDIRPSSIRKPKIFQVHHQQELITLVGIPLSYGKDQSSEVLFLSLKELGLTEQINRELEDEAWHELNNPIAIISMTLSRAKKVRFLDQKFIDDLLDRTRRNFKRIEDYILSQISLQR